MFSLFCISRLLCWDRRSKTSLFLANGRCVITSIASSISFASCTPFRGRTRRCVCRRDEKSLSICNHLHVAHVATTHETFRVTVQFDVPYDLEAPMAAFRVRDAARLASLSRPRRVDCDFHLAAQFWCVDLDHPFKPNERMRT